MGNQVVGNILINNDRGIGFGQLGDMVFNELIHFNNQGWFNQRQYYISLRY